jgi:hypothetical protein
VTIISAKRPDTKVEVILGVDTHLDFHVAVALDHLGREAWGESSVPTTVQGYEMLLRWAEGFGPVRCAGVEKAPAELRGRARSVPESPRDRGAGGGAPGAPAAKLAP